MSKNAVPKRRRVGAGKFRPRPPASLHALTFEKADRIRRRERIESLRLREQEAADLLPPRGRLPTDEYHSRVRLAREHSLFSRYPAADRPVIRVTGELEALRDALEMWLTSGGFPRYQTADTPGQRAIYGALAPNEQLTMRHLKDRIAVKEAELEALKARRRGK